MTAGFREFTGKTLNKTKKPSVRKKLQQAITARTRRNRENGKNRKKNRRSRPYEWDKKYKEEN